jgi:hypothetical protein
MASGSRENPLQLVQFPFSAGIDEGTRDEVVEAGAAWLVLENGRQDQTGGYSTRNGFLALANGHIDATTPTAGYKLLADTTNPVRICDGQAEAYSSKAAAWQTLGRVPECAMTLTPVPTVDSTSSLEDLDVTNGYVALSWLKIDTAPLTATATSWVALIDQATGAIVRAPEKLSTSTATGAPMLLTTVGSSFIAVRLNGTNVEGWAIDTTSAVTINLGWVAFGASLCTDAGGACVVQAIPSVVTPRFALLYVNSSAGTSQLTLKAFDITGTLVTGQTVTINTSSVKPSFPALAGNATDTLWAAWDEVGAIKVCGFSPTSVATTPLASTTQVLTLASFASAVRIAPSSTAGKARLWANDTSSTTRGQMRGVKTTAGAAAVDGSQVMVPGVLLRSKPFFYSGRYYGVFSGGDVSAAAQTQQNLILCDWTADDSWLRPIGNTVPGLTTAGSAYAGKAAAGSVAGQYLFGINVQRSGVASGSAVMTADFNSSVRWQSCPWGNSVYLSGGLASCFDGTRVAEIGFLIRPPKPTTATNATGITGTFRYAFVYEEVDADGNWHQSGVSDPSDSTGAVANKTITVTSQPLGITSRRAAGTGANGGAVRIAIYRTLDGAVAPYYRLVTIPNDTSSATASYADTTGDTVLAARAKLYEQPGVVGTSQDKRPPPFFQCITNYNGCLVGASGSDVWFSGQNVTGEGAWFNPVFQVPVPGDGDITALWVMDGTLFVAKRREMCAITGEAPSDNGASGGLGLPRRLAVDVGCIESRSVCVTAFGTFFQSDRGIEILTRAQSVTWIGQPVQTTQGTYPIVTSATVDPASCTVLIECAQSQSAGLVTATGRTLVYDLSLQKWVSIDRRRSSASAFDAPSQSACMIYTGSAYRYAWMTAAGVVHYEDTTTSLDADGSMVCKRAESANVRAAGFQGLQHVNRVQLLAKYRNAHELTMSFAYDYSSSYAVARTYTNAELSAVATALPNMQLEHPGGADVRCEAVRARLGESTPSSGTLSAGRGATWIALNFEIVTQTGAYALPDVSR